MQLEEQFYETSAMRWKRELPWLRIFRGFRMALDARKLLLAFAGVVVYAAGMALLVQLPFATPDEFALQPVWPWETVTFEPTRATDGVVEGGPPFAAAARSLERAVKRPLLLIRPELEVLSPGSQLFRRGNTWSEVAWAWTRLLWALIVWAIFGGAIARIAALEISGKGSPGLREGLRHATGYLISYIGGPMLPIIGIGVFWVIAAALGLVGAVPGIGPVIAAALWFVPLICGGVLAVILIGIAAGWPLMYCTISTEGSDAFDALSRTYSYLFSRPWYAVFLVLATLIYGSVVTIFLFVAADFAVDLTNWAVASGMGDTAVDALTTPGSSARGAGLAGIWLMALSALLLAYVYSFFWTAMTIAYFLLRHAEDAVPFDQAYWPEPAPNGPALSGIAAAERREQQLESGTSESTTPASATDAGPGPAS